MSSGDTVECPANCLCTWFRFDQDVVGVRFGAQCLQEQGRERSVAVSVPIETKDELVETGLEVLGAQPVADAPSPALEVAERGVDPGENFMGGPVADDMGPVAVPRHRATASPAVCLDNRGRGGVAHSEAAEILGAAGPDRGQPQATLRVAVAEFDRSGDRHLAFRASPRPRRHVFVALRQFPTPSRFCNCRAEMPLQWVAIRQAARNRIASDSLVRCRRVPAATEA